MKKNRNILIYYLSTIIFLIFLKIWNRFKIIGRENIPSKGGVIIASNHASFLDPPIVGSGCFKRPVTFMARDTLWNSKFSKWWLDSVGCIPLSRSFGDTKALKTSIKILNSGDIISLFPEGTRSSNGEIQSAKSGIGFIIGKSQCVVIPAFIHNSYKAFPKGSKSIKPLSICIKFGKPITKDEFKSLGTGRDAYTNYAALVMKKINELGNDFKSI